MEGREDESEKEAWGLSISADGFQGQESVFVTLLCLRPVLTRALPYVVLFILHSYLQDTRVWEVDYLGSVTVSPESSCSILTLRTIVCPRDPPLGSSKSTKVNTQGESTFERFITECRVVASSRHIPVWTHQESVGCDLLTKDLSEICFKFSVVVRASPEMRFRCECAPQVHALEPGGPQLVPGLGRLWNL